MPIDSIRYILMLIDSKSKDHDGKVFKSYMQAKEYAIDCIKDHYADKVVIGMFEFDPQHESMNIGLIETMGFQGDKKDPNQLEMFKPYSTDAD